MALSQCLDLISFVIWFNGLGAWMKVLHISRRRLSGDLKELAYGPDLDHFKALAHLLGENYILCLSSNGKTHEIEKENVRFYLASSIVTLMIRAVRLAGNFDLLVGENPFAAGLVASTAGSLRHKPVIITVHGYDFSHDVKASWKFRLQFYFRHLPLKFCALVRTDSEAVANVIKNWGISKNKIRTLSSRVDCETFKPQIDESAIRNRFNLTGKRVVLYGGSLLPIKGVEVLLDAAFIVTSKITDATFLIVGDGSLHSSLQQRTRDLGLQRNVIFAGRVPYHEMPQYMAAAELLVHPSRTESIGRVLLEAQASEKPVVATKVGGIPEAVRENETALLVPPNDPKSLAEAIMRVLNNRSIAAQMGKNGRAFALEHFDFWSQEEKLVKLYHEVASRDNDQPR